MKISDTRSIIAIDPSAQGISFVFFENGELLDWGGRIVRQDESALGVIDRLVDGYAADLVVLEDPEAHGSRRKPRVRRALAQIAKHLTLRGIRIRRVGKALVRKSWSEHGFRNKEETACAIATRFSELQRLVPTPRKPHDPASKRINIFDAAALVLHVFSSVTELLGR